MENAQNLMSLLRREYLSSAVNVLTNSPKFCITLKEAFFKSITLRVINKYGKGAVVHNARVFGPVCYVARQSLI